MVEKNKYEFDICNEFDCSGEYCIRTTGYDCFGEFWKERCIFYGEHQELNEKQK